MTRWVARGRLKCVLPSGRSRFIQPGEEFGEADVPQNDLKVWQQRNWVSLSIPLPLRSAKPKVVLPPVEVAEPEVVEAEEAEPMPAEPSGQEEA